MSHTIRHFALALLIAVAVSVTALGMHVASHETGDLQTCELCSGQGSPAHAIPPSIVQFGPPQLTYFVREPALIMDIRAVRMRAQPRAPPATA